jgi:hypothetical protein
MNPFNEEISRRLRDLHDACVAGLEVTLLRQPEFESSPGHKLPDRVMFTFGERRFVLALPLSLQLADQMEANGFPEMAARIRLVAG